MGLWDGVYDINRGLCPHTTGAPGTGFQEKKTSTKPRGAVHICKQSSFQNYGQLFSVFCFVCFISFLLFFFFAVCIHTIDNTKQME